MNGQRSDLIARHPLDRPVTRLDGADLRLLIRGAYDWLAHHYEIVNRMNVFPVPDGETGTNMLLTIKSAWSAVQHMDGDAIGPIMRAVADGARHGARGNSGVILGQILLGMSRTLADKADMTAHDLADALQLGAETAYQSVPAPVEGTILTAARAASVAAHGSLVRSSDMRLLFSQVVDEVDRTVQRTPQLLPILRQAGVVDSGAKGLYFVLAGMHRALGGELLPDNPDAHLLEAVDAKIEHQLMKGQRRLPRIHWGFDVQFLVEQPRKPASAILDDIANRCRQRMPRIWLKSSVRVILNRIWSWRSVDSLTIIASYRLSRANILDGRPPTAVGRGSSCLHRFVWRQKITWAS